jgi:hypothetical protein
MNNSRVGKDECVGQVTTANRSVRRRQLFIRSHNETLSVAAMHNELNQPSQFNRRSHNAVIRVYDAAGNVIETHERKGDFKEP